MCNRCHVDGDTHTTNNKTQHKDTHTHTHTHTHRLAAQSRKYLRNVELKKSEKLSGPAGTGGRGGGGGLGGGSAPARARPSEALGAPSTRKV